MISQRRFSSTLRAGLFPPAQTLRGTSIFLSTRSTWKDRSRRTSTFTCTLHEMRGGGDVCAIFKKTFFIIISSSSQSSHHRRYSRRQHSSFTTTIVIASIKEYLILLLSRHVAENSIHIVKVFNQIHGFKVKLLVLLRHLHRGLGLPHEARVLHVVAAAPQALRHSHQIALVSEDVEALGEIVSLWKRLHVFCSSFKNRFQHRVLVGISLDSHLSDVVEVEGNAAWLSQLEVLLVYDSSNVRSGSVVVVGQNVDDETDAAMCVDLH
mmetsp:Transcript_17791/g.58527  ORF Transcript_17791/g.58527 Transcript_17791/m.58527 type:complete len:266 (+) Transcript_17791:2214-3011(+)